MLNFNELQLNDKLINALQKQDISTPTDIQSNIIPLILDKKDVIAQSQTGSGKTLAYLLPIFQNIDMSVRGVQGLILTPTHELAVQVYNQAKLLEENSGLEVGSMLMIGSANSSRQLDKLKTKPRIIVGSTGRILDFIYKRKLPAHLIKTIVLDEGDRLVEDGNFSDIQEIVKATLKERQIILLSASVDIPTQNRIKKLMKPDVSTIESTKGALVPQGIHHFFFLTNQRDKFLQLRKVIASEGVDKVIVFINNPEHIEVTIDKLCHHQISATGIYGQISKEDRKKSLEDFRNGKAKVLVSSDIGARGLDIQGVTHIINMDIPEEPTHYLHRAGRCGRNGLTGTAISFVTPYERKWVNKYARVWDLEFKQKEMSYGKIVDSNKTKKDLEPKKDPNKANKKSNEPEYILVYDDDLGYIEKPVKPIKPKPTSNNTNKAKNTNNTKTDDNSQNNQNNQEATGFFANKAKKNAIKEENRLNSTQKKSNKSKKSTKKSGKRK